MVSAKQKAWRKKFGRVVKSCSKGKKSRKERNVCVRKKLK